MKTLYLAAAAAAAFAAPAFAQDAPGGYVGIEGGVLFPRDSKVDVDVFDSTATNIGGFNDAMRINYDTGYDLDAIAGYDAGMFRLEGELGYKRAGVNSLAFNPNLVDFYNTQTGSTVPTTIDANGHTTVLSAMVNGLVDFNVGGVGVYAGGGVGRAWVTISPDNADFSTNDDSDDAWAYQLIAGAYAPISNNIDIGLKYRYFQTDRLHFNTAYDIGGATYGQDMNGHFSSHSVLASLVYKFGAAAPESTYVPAAVPAPAPAAAPPPATQTCPDGTVISETQACPAPPPPPPPLPPAAGERG